MRAWFTYSAYIAVTHYITMPKPILRTEPVDLYEVYITNADHEQLVIKHQGFSRDIAESVMIKLHTVSGFDLDLMLYNKTKDVIVCETLTNKTLSARGWCQQ